MKNQKLLRWACSLGSLLCCATPAAIAWSPQGSCTGPDDALENNDSCASPGFLNPGSYTDLYVSQTDLDFYNITIPPYHFLDIMETMDVGGTEYVFFDAGVCFYQVSGTSDTQITLANGYSFPLTFQLQARSQGACSNYGFDVILTPDPCNNQGQDSMEPNDSCGTAVSLTYGLHVGLTAGIFDADFYQTSAGPYETVQLEIQSATSNFTEVKAFAAGCTTPISSSKTLAWYTNPGATPTDVVFSVTKQDSGELPSCFEYQALLLRTTPPCLQPPGDRFEPNQDCDTPAPLTTGLHVGLSTVAGDEDWYRVCLPAGSGIHMFVEVIGGPIEVSILSGNSPCAPASNPSIVTSSLAIGPFSPGFQDEEVFLRVRALGTTSSVCSDYSLDLVWPDTCTGAAVATFCDPNNANSTGAATSLYGSHGTGVGSGLRLFALNGPPGEFAYVLVGTGSFEPGLSLGNGRMCLRTSAPNWIGRYNQTGTALDSIGQFNAVGWYEDLTPTGNGNMDFYVPLELPQSNQPTIQSGQTFFFQLWHRDGTSSNFSSGLAARF